MVDDATSFVFYTEKYGKLRVGSMKHPGAEVKRNPKAEIPNYTDGKEGAASIPSGGESTVTPWHYRYWLWFRGFLSVTTSVTKRDADRDTELCVSAMWVFHKRQQGSGGHGRVRII